jgi:uncharacterized cupredoxin-like copper-binding protein
MHALGQGVRNVFLGATVISGLIGTTPFMAVGAAPVANHDAVDALWGTPGDSAKVTKTVRIVATEIKFDVTHLTFKKGETISFLFVNEGKQAHEFMIADAAEQAEHRNMMSRMWGTTMPASGHDEGNVVDAKPGETKELIWTFTKAGTFQFACNYIGHAEAGMIGTIDVQ